MPRKTKRTVRGGKGLPVGAGQKVLRRPRNGSVQVAPTPSTTPIPIGKANGREYISIGKYSMIDRQGKLVDDTSYRTRRRAMLDGMGMSKMAGLFSDGGLGFADIGDSQNMGYYNFEFPVDMLEMPQSRQEELRYYRLAYDRDAFVSRAIDLHTEIPMSKFSLEKPKSSSDEYADYVFDFYQQLANDSRMFETFVEATREYWMFGEVFLFIEVSDDDVDPCPAAQKILEKQEEESSNGLNEAENGTEAPDALLNWLSPEKRSSLIKKHSKLIADLKKRGVKFDPEESIAHVMAEIKGTKIKCASLNGAIQKIKLARVIKKTAEPAPPADPAAPPVDDPAAAGNLGADAGNDQGDAPPVDEGAPDGGGGGGVPMGGGGGDDLPDVTQEAITTAEQARIQGEIRELRHLLQLLQKKRDLLEELQEVRERKKKELDLFSHLVNKSYRGFDRIRILPPEQVEVKNDTGTDSEIFYKPQDNVKASYLEDPNLPDEIKERLEQDGLIPLNKDPMKGSYVIHFARKKTDYELHGRSILQRVLRTIIYREKLRQVQSTLASRNMTPKTMIVAPEAPAASLVELRAHLDEAIADPDYTIVLNFEARWDQIGNDGRLLALDNEWAHTEREIAVGMGFTPEILMGEGMYGGNRIQLEILNTTYLQYRDIITHIVEDGIFRPIAMKKGFYELDKFGRPRWIYPKVTFSRMALRDSGDLYDMMFNMYSKGALPVSLIYEFLNVDPETMKRQLEEDIFTVNDSKFNTLIENLYANLPEKLIAGTDIVKRVSQGLTLEEEDMMEEGLEGSGEGV